MTDTIEVDAQRSGQWWALSVVGMPGVHSQVRSLTQAEFAITEAIALATDRDPGDVVVVVRPKLPDGLLERVRSSRSMVAEAEQLQHEAARASREAAKALLDAGLTQREAAHVMGISFQRVSQLVG